MPGRRRRILVTGMLLALMLAVVVAGPWMAAHANGRVVRFDRRIAGPYEIAVGTIPATPRVGSLHLTMMVTDVASETVILDADVTITGTGPGSDAVEIGPLVVKKNISDPVYYDVNTSVDRVGTWNFTVAVSSDRGDASADFPIEVLESSPAAGIILLVALLAFLVVVGFSIRTYIRERGRSRRVRRRRA